MYAKLFILTLVATACVQCFVDGSYFQKLEATGLTGPVDRLLKKLEAVIQKAIDKATVSLKSIEDDIQVYGKRVTDDLDAEMKKRFSRFEEELNTLKEQAKSLGVDITDCLQDEQKFLDLPAKFSDLGTACVTDNIKGAENILTVAGNTVNDTLNSVVDLSNQHKKCGNGLFSLACKTRVATKISLEIMEAPRRIKKDVSKAQKSVNNLKTPIDKCEWDNVLQLGVEASAASNTITVCINGKIKH